MPIVIAGLLVLAVGASLLTALPRPTHAPQTLVLGGNLTAFVAIVPAAVARIQGDR